MSMRGGRPAIRTELDVPMQNVYACLPHYLGRAGAGWKTIHAGINHIKMLNLTAHVNTQPIQFSNKFVHNALHAASTSNFSNHQTSAYFTASFQMGFSKNGPVPVILIMCVCQYACNSSALDERLSTNEILIHVYQHI
jgi:hypothetical protein